MFETQTSRFITAITNKILGRGKERFHAEWSEDFRTVTQNGIIFKIDASAADHISEEDGFDYDRHEENATVWFVLCGNTSVFFFNDWKEDERYRRIEDVPLEKFTNTSNHDSCWTSDGVDSPLSRLYFEMCAAVNEWRDGLGLVSKAPINIHTSGDLSWGAEAPWTEVKVTTRISEDNEYRREIVKIEKV